MGGRIGDVVVIWCAHCGKAPGRRVEGLPWPRPDLPTPALSCACGGLFLVEDGLGRFWGWAPPGLPHGHWAAVIVSFPRPRYWAMFFSPDGRTDLAGLDVAEGARGLEAAATAAAVMSC